MVIGIFENELYLSHPGSASKLVYKLNVNPPTASEMFKKIGTLICWDFVETRKHLLQIGMKEFPNFFDIRQANCFLDSSKAIDEKDRVVELIDVAEELGVLHRNEAANLKKGQPMVRILLVGKCYISLKGSLKERELEQKFIDEMEHVEYIFQMTEDGMPFSEIAAEKTIKSLNTLMEKLETKMKKEVDSSRRKTKGPLSFKKESDQRKYIYDILKMEAVDGKKSNSISKDVLESLSKQDSKVQVLIDYRRASKAETDLSAYLESSNENRIYSYPCLVHRTGRLSLDNPALQMVQNEFDCSGKTIKVRNCFRTSSGYQFVSVDYRQLELRMLAVLSADDGLCASFLSTEDPFITIGKKWLRKERISPEQRSQVKALVYGVIYGMGNKTLGRNLGVPEEEAKVLCNEFMDSYPKMKEFLDDTHRFAQTNLYTQTISGRRRSFTNYSSRSKRVAVNTKIQGSAADIVKDGTVRVMRKLRETQLDAKLVLQLHDELIFEVKDRDRRVLEDILANLLPLRGEYPVDFDVKIKKGASWDRLK